MEMYFVTTVKFHDLLFKGLDINNTSEMVGACIITFLVAIGCEALKLLQLYLSLRLNENPLSRVVPFPPTPSDSNQTADAINHSNTHDEVVLLSSLRFPANLRQIQAGRLMFHSLSTLNHLFHLFWGYVLMLLVMTYSVWLTVAVVTGCGAGYFVFGAFRQKLEKKFSQQPTVNTQHVPSGEHQCQDAAETAHI